jgi:hypothetical protein
MVEVACKISFGRSSSPSKRLIKVLFPALLSPATKCTVIRYFVPKNSL